MASFIDAMAFLETTGLFKLVLPGILIVVLVYALLSRYSVFGDEKTGLNVIIAFVIGFMFMSFSQALDFVSYLIPFFVAMLVGALLIMLVFRFMGVSEETIGGALARKEFFLVIVAIIILGLIASFNFAFPQYTAFAIGGTIDAPIENATHAQQIQLETVRILFDPTVMAMIVMFVVFIAVTFVVTMKNT